jgi:hypothetical protein
MANSNPMKNCENFFLKRKLHFNEWHAESNIVHQAKKMQKVEKKN